MGKNRKRDKARILLRPVFLAVLLAALFGCESRVAQTPSGKTGTVSEEPAEQEYEFEGTIAEISGTGGTVKADEGSLIRRSGELVRVSLESVSEAKVGDRVRVVYSGGVMETAPLQLGKQLSIEILEAEEENSLSGVGMTLIGADRTGARLELSNETDLELLYGDEYGLQVWEDGAWKDVPWVIENAGFSEIAYRIPKREPVSLSIDWEWLYGTLEPGHYRLVKEITDFRGTGDDTNYRFAAEFELGEEAETAGTLQEEPRAAQEAPEAAQKALEAAQGASEASQKAPEESVTSESGILQEPPALGLQDALSSTWKTFEVTSGNYTWYTRTENAGEMSGITACGSAPMDAGSERTPLDLPSYNRIDFVPFEASFSVMPDRLTVKEYDAADIGDTEAEAISEMVFEETFFLELRPGCVYVIEAEWNEDGLDRHGFYGSAEYAVICQ